MLTPRGEQVALRSLYSLYWARPGHLCLHICHARTRSSHRSVSSFCRHRTLLSWARLTLSRGLFKLRLNFHVIITLTMDTYSLGYFTWLYLSLMLDVSSLGLVYGCFISCFVRLVGKQKSPISASQNMLLPLARAIKNGSA